MKEKLVLFFLCLLALLSIFYDASDIVEVWESRKNNSTVTLETAKEFLGELLPLVERNTGKTLQQIPEITFISRDEMKKILTDESFLHYGAGFTASKKKDIVKNAKSNLARLAKITMGKYGLLDKVIYLVPRNIHQEIRRIKGNEKTEASLYKQYIAHELTHAIQDQELGMAKRYHNMAGAEERDSFSALIEGHAMLVQEMVTQELNLPPLSYQEKVLSSKVPLHHKASRDIWAYSKGKTFIEYFYDKGGNKRVWEILNAPPVRTAIINTPQEYTPLPDTSTPDYSKILHGIEKYLGKGKWLVEDVEMTHKDLFAVLYNLGPKKRDLLLNQTKNSQSIKFIKEGNKSQIGGLAIIALKDPDFVDSFFSLMEKLIKREQKLREKSSLSKIKKLEIEKLDLITSGKTHKISYISQGRENNKIVVARGARENLVIEISTFNINLSNEKIKEIMEIVFQRWVLANEQFNKSNTVVFTGGK